MIDSSDKPSLAEALSAARDTRVLEIGSGVLNKTPDIFRRQFGNRTAVVVADVNTFAVAGRRVLQALEQSGQPCRQPLIFSDPGLYAEHSRVTELEASLKQHDAIPIAVGSGTINDLTKLAAHRSGRSYLCIATAASMDGYTAFGASITHQGSKQTFDCPAPAGVIADLDIICNAPGDMNAWGYTDLLAKITAGADWILADALGLEPVQPQPWSIVQGRLRELLSDPAGVRSRKTEAVHQLTEGLMLGGFAMQAARSSRAASGAEHQFSHLWDMQHHTHNGTAPSHGFKVGIGTLAVTALYECMLAQPLEKLDLDACCAQWPNTAAWEIMVHELFQDGELVEVAMREARAKDIDAKSLRAQLDQLCQVWPSLRKRLIVQLMPLTELKKTLQTVGAPVEPEQIGIPRTRLRDSFRQAYFIRRRFTILDLAMRTGLLDTALRQIFSASGAWPSLNP
jgi:glycerol-1-phosphate dehydrogenase [NAD(P)+]